MNKMYNSNITMFSIILSMVWIILYDKGQNKENKLLFTSLVYTMISIVDCIFKNIFNYKKIIHRNASKH